MRKPNESNERFERAMFRLVMTQYDTYRSAQGRCGSPRYAPRIIPMLPEDFMVDVEKAAARALRNKPAHFAAFNDVYIGKDDEFEGFEEMKHEIQELVGAEFQRCGVYPVSSYMKAVDCR